MPLDRPALVRYLRAIAIDPSRRRSGPIPVPDRITFGHSDRSLPRAQPGTTQECAAVVVSADSEHVEVRTEDCPHCRRPHVWLIDPLSDFTEARQTPCALGRVRLVFDRQARPVLVDPARVRRGGRPMLPWDR